MSVHAAVVTASSDQDKAAKFVAELDDAQIDLAAQRYTRPQEMASLDAKLYSSILNMLPSNEDGENPQQIKDGSQFC